MERASAPTHITFSRNVEKLRRNDPIGAIVGKWPTDAAHGYDKLLTRDKGISDADKQLLSKLEVINTIGQLNPEAIAKVVWYLGYDNGRSNIPVVTSDRVLKSFGMMTDWKDDVIVRMLNSVIFTVPSTAMTDPGLLKVLGKEHSSWRTSVFISAGKSGAAGADMILLPDVMDLISRKGVADSWMAECKVSLLLARIKRQDTRFTDEKFLEGLNVKGLFTNQRAALLMAALQAESLDLLFSQKNIRIATVLPMDKFQLIPELVKRSKANTAAASQPPLSQSLRR